MLLKKGSNSDDVKKLQEKLGLAADGIFGAGTETKVKEWQAANGLTADGIVGDGTWSKMFGGVAPSVIKEDVVIAKAGPLNIDKLKGHIPDAVIAQIPETAAKFNITNNLRLAHFLSQCGHESGGFKAVNENLNYSAKGLMGTFKKYFPNDELARQYERKPEKIANRVYASRMANGDEASGDGYRFCGRGLIQLTGRANYTKFAADLGISIEETVAYLETPEGAVSSAGWFWDNNNLNQYCDNDDFVTLTKRINGGTIGLEDRQHHYHLALDLLQGH